MPDTKKTIYDLGFHIGQDTLFYLKKGFRVVAIEANPVLFQKGLAKYGSEIENGQLTLLNIGIGREAGEFDFYINHTHSEWSSFIEEIGAREGTYSSVKVPCKKLEEVVEEYGEPYYLKIDIEGHDFIALQSVKRIKNYPKYISVENGQKPLLDEMVALGYDSFKFINQAEVEKQILPHPALEGHYVEHSFEFGASGTFGEETPGEWLSYEAVLEKITAYWGRPDRDANIHGWFDLHGRLKS